MVKHLFWVVLKTPSWSLLPGPVWTNVLVPDRVPSLAEIGLFEINRIRLDNLHPYKNCISDVTTKMQI